MKTDEERRESMEIREKTLRRRADSRRDSPALVGRIDPPEQTILHAATIVHDSEQVRLAVSCAGDDQRQRKRKSGFPVVQAPPPFAKPDGLPGLLSRRPVS